MLPVTHYIAGFPLFIAYFFIALALTSAYAFIYTRITPHDEIALIKDNKSAASIAFSGSLLGFVFPLASVITHSIDIVDMLIWGTVALAIQLFAFFGLRLFFPKISECIANNEMATGIWLGTVSLSAGLLNAACLTY
ncbi:DUF350 domain-containing protein [Endozoicomonas sp. Mp262]|uniref:DUF350 domain-containing protein n=1 Tax=Endozoicomonas sp. Mp262 TaxID=2919499 RepID=UPI0021D8EFB5